MLVPGIQRFRVGNKTWMLMTDVTDSESPAVIEKSV